MGKSREWQPIMKVWLISSLINGACGHGISCPFVSQIQVSRFERLFRETSVLVPFHFIARFGFQTGSFSMSSYQEMITFLLIQTFCKRKRLRVQVSWRAHCNFNAHIPFSRTKYLHIMCGFSQPCAAIFRSIKEPRCQAVEASVVYCSSSCHFRRADTLFTKMQMHTTTIKKRHVNRQQQTRKQGRQNTKEELPRKSREVLRSEQGRRQRITPDTQQLR